MALIKCKECDAEVSKKAESCPSCGNPINKQTKNGSGCATVIVFLVAAYVLFSIFSPDKPQKTTPSVVDPALKSDPRCEQYVADIMTAIGLVGAVTTCSSGAGDESNKVYGIYKTRNNEFEYSLVYMEGYLVKSVIDGVTRNHNVGQWFVYENIDSLTEEPVYHATVSATSGKSKWGKPFSLSVRCEASKTEVWINWKEYLGDDSHDVYEDWKWVSTRIGKAPIKKRKWSISTDKKASFYPSAGYKFAKQMVGQAELVAETIPYNENVHTAVFDITGAGAALYQVRKACNW